VSDALAYALRRSLPLTPAAIRPRLRLPGTTRPRFALHGAQRSQSPDPPLFGCVNKVGSLPSGRVVLSLALRRYFEPLRLPRRPRATSALALYPPVGGSAPPPPRISRTALLVFRYIPPMLPRKIQCNASVVPLHRLRPSPSDHRVGTSNFVTRLPLGSLALRPVALPLGNLQPPITRTLLPGARTVYGQLLSRDLNPQEKQPVTAYGQARYISYIPTQNNSSPFRCLFSSLTVSRSAPRRLLDAQALHA